MKQVIYIDVLFITNQFINYFLLLTTAKISRACFTRLRLLLAASVGGVYSFIIFLDSVPAVLSAALKVVFCVSLILFAFKLEGKKHFFKLLATFVAVNVAFAGIMLALYLAVKPQMMVYKNGAVYFDLNLRLLAVLTLLCYLLVLVISKLTRKGVADEHIFDLTVYFGGKSVSVKAMLDTGNSLTDAFTGYPVIVAFVEPFKEIIDSNLYECVKNKNLFNLHEELQIHPITYHHIGGDGVLAAFRPEKIRLKGIKSDITTDKVYIALTDERIKQGEYSALLNGTICSQTNLNINKSRRKTI